MLHDFTMLIGIPGSGKSSYLRLLRKTEKFSCVCPDEIRLWLTGDISNQTENDVVWKIATYTTIRELESGLKVVLDATNVNTKLRRNFILKLKSNIPTLRMKAVIFDISPEESIKRIKNHKDSVILRPDVPDEIVYRMYGEYLYTKKVISEENWDSISVLAQNE